MPKLKVRNISKSFGPIRALKDVNFEAEDTGITSVVGVSGAGKTTLLRLIAGLETPSSGEILLDGRLEKEVNLRKRTTMVFQKTVMFGSTAYDNLAYGLRIRHLSEEEIRRRVEDVLKVVRMDGYERRIARKLSGGEQQRISLARALILRPEILLLDEPTANLDLGNAGIIESVLRETASQKQIVLATHNLAQAKRLAAKVVHLAEGFVAEEGPPEVLFQHPRDERTRRLINGEV